MDAPGSAKVAHKSLLMIPSIDDETRLIREVV